MDVLAEITWGDTLYLGTCACELDSKQYEERIINIRFSSPFARWGDYQETTLSLTLSDFDKKFRNLLSAYATKYNQGAQAVFKKTDGVRIATLYYQDFELGENTVTLTYSNRIKGFSNEPANKDMTIDQKRYPNAPEWGKAIPWFIGNFKTESASKKGENSIIAYRIDDNLFVLGEPGDNGTPIKQYILDSDFSTDVTANYTIETAADVGFPASDPVYYVKKTSGTTTEPYLYVNFGFTPFKTAREVVEAAMDKFFPGIEYESDELAILSQGNWHFDSIPAQRDTPLDIHFAVISPESGVEILQKLCQQLNFHYRISKTGKVFFRAIDYENITIREEWQEGISHNFIMSFPAREDSSKVMNYSDSEMGFQYYSNSHYEKFNFKKPESVKRLGYQRAGPFSKSRINGAKLDTHPHYHEKPHITLKHQMIELKYPERNYIFTADIDTFYDLRPGDLVKFGHPQLDDDQRHLFLVINISTNFKETASIACIDISNYETLDKDCITHIISNADFDGESRIFDVSVSGHNFVTGYNGVLHDTSDFKYGTSCMVFDGTDDYFALGSSGRHFDFDIWSYPYWIIAFWVKFPVLGSIENIVSQYVDATHQWVVRKDGNDKFRFVMIDGVNTIVLGANTAITSTTTWYFCLFHKFGTTAGSGTHDYRFFWQADPISFPGRCISDGSTTSAYHVTTPFAAGLEVGRLDGVCGEFKMSELLVWKNNQGPTNSFILNEFPEPAGIIGDHKNYGAFSAPDKPY